MMRDGMDHSKMGKQMDHKGKGGEHGQMGMKRQSSGRSTDSTGTVDTSPSGTAPSK